MEGVHDRLLVHAYCKQIAYACNESLASCCTTLSCGAYSGWLPAQFHPTETSYFRCFGPQDGGSPLEHDQTESCITWIQATEMARFVVPDGFGMCKFGSSSEVTRS